MQILPDGIGQAGSHRRVETEGGHVACRRRDHAIQAGKSDGVRVGNTWPAAVWRRLFVGEYSQCQLHQQVREWYQDVMSTLLRAVIGR